MHKYIPYSWFGCPRELNYEPMDSLYIPWRTMNYVSNSLETLYMIQLNYEPMDSLYIPWGTMNYVSNSLETPYMIQLNYENWTV